MGAGAAAAGVLELVVWTGATHSVQTVEVKVL